jgi:hypothetical protein
MPLDLNAIACRRPEFEMFPLVLIRHDAGLPSLRTERLVPLIEQSGLRINPSEGRNIPQKGLIKGDIGISGGR